MGAKSDSAVLASSFRVCFSQSSHVVALLQRSRTEVKNLVMDVPPASVDLAHKWRQNSCKVTGRRIRPGAKARWSHMAVGSRARGVPRARLFLDVLRSSPAAAKGSSWSYATIVEEIARHPFKEFLARPGCAQPLL